MLMAKRKPRLTFLRLATLARERARGARAAGRAPSGMPQTRLPVLLCRGSAHMTRLTCDTLLMSQLVKCARATKCCRTP